MSKGIKTAKDGTLVTTLGKKLIESVKFKASELREPVMFTGPCKELSFAIVNGDISLFIDELKEENRLTIEEKCSIEANVNVAWLQAPNTTRDDEEFEIWVWS